MKTVLIIDDEEAVRNLLNRFLRSLGFFVISVDCTNAAMSHLPDADIVLSDVRIGNDNGIEFLRQLRNQGVEKPFLLMSGDMYPAESEMAIEITGHPVFFKPDILRTLPSIIGKPSASC